MSMGTSNIDNKSLEIASNCCCDQDVPGEGPTRSLKMHMLTMAMLTAVVLSIITKSILYDVLKPVQFVANKAWSKRPGLVCDRQVIAQKHMTAGKHHLVDMYGIRADKIKLLESIKILPVIEEYIGSAGLTLLDYSSHHFECGGITAVFLLSESHVSLHSWPEHGFVALDVYTCGSGRPEEITEKFKFLLQPESVKHSYIERGEHIHTLLTPWPYGVMEPSTNSSLPLQLFGGIEFVPQKIGAPGISFSSNVDQIDICVNADNEEDDCFLHRNVQIHADVQSPYQRIEVVDTQNLGRCMLLDRVIQFCEEDNQEYTFQLTNNAMTQITGIPAANELPALEPIPALKIVIIGGGDGWVASHLLDEYASHIKSIQIVDIDEQVAKLTRKFFEEEGDHSSFTDERVQWTFQDAGIWLNNLPSHVRPGSVDLVIIDCTDHTKEASKVLYTNEFYTNVFRLLKKNGKVVQQMNTDDDSYTPFFELIRNQWRNIGFTQLLEWSTYMQSYSGMSVFWMASKE